VKTLTGLTAGCHSYDGPGVFTSIVVGTDGSDTATEAVRQAGLLAAKLGATVHVVSAYEPVPERRLRDEHNRPRPDLQWMLHPRESAATTLEQARQLLASSGLEVEVHAREGDPADAILDIAEEQDADLIVVGNKGMTGAKRFLLGSVPNKISHHAPCSVMIIRTT
jgi:nucleotide-binding universal stress UspA family protein